MRTLFLTVLLSFLAVGEEKFVPKCPGSATIPPSADGLKITPQVQAWAKYWQTRLGLLDWNVEVRVVRSCELRPDTLGNIKWNSGHKTGTLKILDPLDYDMPRELIAEDIEYTIVHELLHLQLSVLPRDPGKKEVEEAVVNRIADALMALYKGPAFTPRSPKPKAQQEADRLRDPAMVTVFK